MGIDLTTIKFDINQFALIIQNDTRIKNILRVFDEIANLQPISSSLILPILEETSYDCRFLFNKPHETCLKSIIGA